MKLQDKMKRKAECLPALEKRQENQFKGQNGIRLCLANHEVFLGLSGYVYFIEQRLLIVSDLHLEKASFYAKSGQFLPPYDSEVTLLRLREISRILEPENIISLGDSFHDEEGPLRLSNKSRRLLHELVGEMNWTWISGNHDANLPESLGGAFMDKKTLAPFIFRHEPTKSPNSFEIAGHLHPSAHLTIRGRRVRKPCFILSKTRLILPAFGALTGGLDVSDEAFAPFITPSCHALLMGEAKLYSIPLLDCIST